MNWYDYGFRNYDAQIGRFTQLDPLTWEYPDLTPYQYSGNDPIANVDLDGLEPLTSISSGLGQVNMLNEVVVHGIRKSASVTGSFFKGLGNSVWSTLKAVKHVVTNPIQTVKGIGNAIAHPIETGKALYAHAKDTYNAFKEGDAEKRAEILGNLTGDIGQIFTGTAAANAGLKLARVSSVTKKIVKVVENTRVVKPVAKTGGRLGNSTTRTQIGEIATELESRGYTITRGGGRFPEEYLKPLGGGRSGGSYLDLTAIHPKYGTLRINTVDVYKNGSPTLRELNNAKRIRTQIAPGEHLLLIPKR